jgi:hypothetical protein
MLIIGCPIQWDPDGDRCPSSRRALNVEGTALLLCAPSHAQQTECVRPGLLHTGDTSVVVFDLQGHMLTRLIQSDVDLGGLSMPRHVGQALLEDAEQRIDCSRLKTMMFPLGFEEVLPSDAS